MLDTSLHSKEGTRYRYDHPRMYPDVMNDMFLSSKDLGPGDYIGGYDLRLTDGASLDDRAVARDGKYVLFVFGSLTCPVTESAAEGLRLLSGIYKARVRFVMVNVREAHPGRKLPQPKTFDSKMEHAIALKRHHGFDFDVACDDIDGSFHRRFGARPNSAYMVDPHGKILFLAQWANETSAIDDAISAVLIGKGPKNPKITNTFHAMTQMVGFMRPVMRAAGRGATIDTWKVAPPLGILMMLERFFFFLRPKNRGLPSMVLMMGLMAAAILASRYT